MDHSFLSLFVILGNIFLGLQDTTVISGPHRLLLLSILCHSLFLLSQHWSCPGLSLLTFPLYTHIPYMLLSTPMSLNTYVHFNASPNVSSPDLCSEFWTHISNC